MTPMMMMMMTTANRATIAAEKNCDEGEKKLKMTSLRVKILWHLATK